MARYLSVTCDLSDQVEEQLASLLGEFAVLGSSIQEGKQGTTTATIYLDADRADEAHRLGASLAAIGGQSIVTQPVEDRDWLAAYRCHVQPFAIGERWWVDPEPHGETPVPKGRIRLTVEPSTAFGSGSHESTQLVLMVLEELDPRDATVLDVGTGSGILGFAAAALGARMVVGLDVDPQAIWVARRLARQQGCSAVPVLVAAPVTALGGVRFDVILCNLISGEFVPLMPELRRLLAPHGQLVLSGALEKERAMVKAEVASAGLRTIAELGLGEWLAVRVGHG